MFVAGKQKLLKVSFFSVFCSQHQPEGDSQLCRSVLLLSERNTSHVVGVLRYVKRTNALLPPELVAFAQGVHEAREDQKMDRALCSYLKSFGFCRFVDSAHGQTFNLISS